MNFQEYRKKKLFITDYEEYQLVSMLTRNCSKTTKGLIKLVIKNKFYSYFIEKDFIRFFYLENELVCFKVPDSLANKVSLTSIRLEILKDLKEGKVTWN